MTRMTGPDCAVMQFNKYAYILHTYIHTYKKIEPILTFIERVELSVYRYII